MEDFHYERGSLYCEDVPLSEIARSAGTPTYVYSHAALERAYKELDEAFSGLDHLVCYAVKANANPGRSAGAGLLRCRGGHCFRWRTLPDDACGL